MRMLQTHAPEMFSDINLTLIRFLVRRLSPKFQVNCALFDTNMKFGTLIEACRYKHFQI